MGKPFFRRFKDFFELIRLPGMFTAHADILAAFLVCGAGSHQFISLFWLLAATSCFFSSGMALNDYFDADIDAKERPGRPIPSGRITGKTALASGLVLMISGVGFTWLAGSRSFLIGLGLAAAILVYDGVLKKYSLAGPLAMAACRYLNFLMGLSIMPFDGWGAVPMIIGVYILGVTILSRKEAQGGRAVWNIGGCAACIGTAALICYGLYLGSVLPRFAGVCLVLVLGVFLSAKVLHLLEKHKPGNYQVVMKQLLMSIIFMDTAIAACAVSLWQAMAVVLLIIPAKMSVRLFRVT